MIEEQWLPYQKLPTYEVSTLGNVRNAKRKGGGGGGTVLAQYQDRKGSYMVGLSIQGKRISMRVARMVGETFVPNPEGLPCVGHVDGDLANNRADNLQWMTMAQICHIPEIRSRMGRKMRSVKGTNILTGETRTFTSMVDAAEWLRENGHPKAAASHICDCCLERLVKAYGHSWRYCEEECR